jgi:hypothetical protein
MKSASLLRSSLYGTIMQRSFQSMATFSSASLLPPRQPTALKTKTTGRGQDAALLSSAKSALLKQILGEQNKLNDIITSIQRINQNIQQQKTTPETVENAVIRFPDSFVGGFQVLNRNGRVPRRANHGKRPVCRAGRRHKRRKWGNHKR